MQSGRPLLNLHASASLSFHLSVFRVSNHLSISIFKSSSMCIYFPQINYSHLTVQCSLTHTQFIWPKSNMIDQFNLSTKGCVVFSSLVRSLNKSNNQSSLKKRSEQKSHRRLVGWSKRLVLLTILCINSAFTLTDFKIEKKNRLCVARTPHCIKLVSCKYIFCVWPML